ncbi:hypothetical protein FOZ60_011820 [Perkinsus olseni]|uniref:Uncharacterized protein n=1 Tax=Perkinsus olseni TaxID=32597 RepID=A0A7J6PM15_PEROL|nr:hypothetical protein FOZ60_011820 [Perkinsus olseni]
MVWSTDMRFACLPGLRWRASASLIPLLALSDFSRAKCLGLTVLSGSARLVAVSSSEKWIQKTAAKYWGYTDAPLTVSHMCVDPLSGCLVLVDNTRRLLYLVFEWESRDAPLAIAEPQGHRIRPVLEAERVGALFSACCCGDGFVYCLSLTEDAEGVVRIDVRDDVGASHVVHRARGEYQSLVATSHEGTTELLWIQTQLKRNPESELVLWTSAVGRRTVTTVDFAVGWLDVDNSRRLAWLCGFSRGAGGMRLWRVDLATEAITGIFPLSAGLRGCRIFAQANGRFWLLESASRKLRVLFPVFDSAPCAISEN